MIKDRVQFLTNWFEQRLIPVFQFRRRFWASATAFGSGNSVNACEHLVTRTHCTVNSDELTILLNKSSMRRWIYSLRPDLKLFSPLFAPFILLCPLKYRQTMYDLGYL